MYINQKQKEKIEQSMNTSNYCLFDDEDEKGDKKEDKKIKEIPKEEIKKKENDFFYNPKINKTQIISNYNMKRPYNNNSQIPNNILNSFELFGEKSQRDNERKQNQNNNTCIVNPDNNRINNNRKIIQYDNINNVSSNMNDDINNNLNINDIKNSNNNDYNINNVEDNINYDLNDNLNINDIQYQNNKKHNNNNNNKNEQDKMDIEHNINNNQLLDHPAKIGMNGNLKNIDNNCINNENEDEFDSQNNNNINNNNFINRSQYNNYSNYDVDIKKYLQYKNININNENNNNKNFNKSCLLYNNNKEMDNNDNNSNKPIIKKKNINIPIYNKSNINRNKNQINKLPEINKNVNNQQNNIIKVNNVKGIFNLDKDKIKNMIPKTSIIKKRNHSKKAKETEEQRIKREKEEKEKNNIRNNLKCYLCFGKTNLARLCPNCKKIACEKCLITMLKKIGKCKNCDKEMKLEDMVPLPFMNDLTSYFIHNVDNYQNQQLDESKDVEDDEDMKDNNGNDLNDNNDFIRKKHNDLPNCEKHPEKKIEYYCLQCNEYYCSKCLVFFNQKSVDLHKEHKILEIEKLNKFKINGAIQEYKKLSTSKNELSKKIDEMTLKRKEYEIKKIRYIKILESLKEDITSKYEKQVRELDEVLDSLKEKKENIESSIYSVPNSFNNIIERNDYGQGSQITEELKKLNDVYNDNNEFKDKCDKITNIKRNLNIEYYESEKINIVFPNEGNYIEEFNIIDKEIKFITNHDSRFKVQLLGGNIIFSLFIKIEDEYYHICYPKFHCHIIFTNSLNRIEYTEFNDQIYSNGENILCVEIAYETMKDFIKEDNQFDFKLIVVKSYYK